MSSKGKMVSKSGEPVAVAFGLSATVFGDEVQEFACGWGAAVINVAITFPINKVIFRQVSFLHFWTQINFLQTFFKLRFLIIEWSGWISAVFILLF